MFTVSRYFLETSKGIGFSVKGGGKTETASPGSSQYSPRELTEVLRWVSGGSISSLESGKASTCICAGQLVTPASPTSASSHTALPPGLGSLHFTHQTPTSLTHGSLGGSQLRSPSSHLPILHRWQRLVLTSPHPDSPQSRYLSPLGQRAANQGLMAKSFIFLIKVQLIYNAILVSGTAK